MKNTLVITILTVLLSSCIGKDQVGKVIEENPQIIANAIKKNPQVIMEALQEAAVSMKQKMAEQREVEEKKKLEDAYNNPLKPMIRKDESFRGTASAPITLIEYSDFECPFCGRGYNTVLELLQKYKGKIRFVYKHLPLNFHPNAMPASQYYEAIRLQSKEKAFKFHDLIYERQGKLKNGKKFLDKLAKEVGANISKLKKDLNSKIVQERIDQDMKEAAKYGFQGTPGFLINGIPVKGAYPVNHFISIVEELVKRGKLKI